MSSGGHFIHCIIGTFITPVCTNVLLLKGVNSETTSIKMTISSHRLQHRNSLARADNIPDRENANILL